MNKKLVLSIAAWVMALLFMGAEAWAHPDVILKDANGVMVNGTTNPYSPKISCGLAACHQSTYALDNSLDNIYESHWDLASKSQINRAGDIRAYTVPYPQHGVSASYHVQMGRNDSWGDVQRQYYNGLENFTSSSGHYGRF